MSQRRHSMRYPYNFATNSAAAMTRLAWATQMPIGAFRTLSRRAPTALTSKPPNVRKSDVHWTKLPPRVRSNAKQHSIHTGDRISPQRAISPLLATVGIVTINTGMTKIEIVRTRKMCWRKTRGILTSNENKVSDGHRERARLGGRRA